MWRIASDRSRRDQRFALHRHRPLLGQHDGLEGRNQGALRFAALGLFNMPFTRNEGLGRLRFRLQKLLTVFPRFSAKQASTVPC